MSNQSTVNKKNLVTWLLMALACIVMARVVPHPPNFAPLNAICIVTGAIFGLRAIALVAPLLMFYVSDLIINNTIGRPFIDSTASFIVWEDFMWGTYLSYGIILLLSAVVLKKHNFKKLFAGSLVATVIFFLITNFFVWLSSPIYPTNLAGLMACYGLGLEYILNPTLGDLFFTLTLYGIFRFYTSNSLALQNITNS